MRITTFALIGVLAIGATAAFADPETRQLNQDIREDKGDLKKNSADAAHDRSDIRRDRGIVAGDRSQEALDLAQGNAKGAAYWNRQAKDERSNIRADKNDLAHSERDIHTDKVRLAKTEVLKRK
ncbi:MAG: hypothetical protein ACLQJ0_19070 [Steroidobacteraceae bacterium]|jgi:hypothetical protein